METLCARVNPAVVNVTVASRAKPRSLIRPGREFSGSLAPARTANASGLQIEHGLGSGNDHLSRWVHRHQQPRVDGATDIRVTMKIARSFRQS